MQAYKLNPSPVKARKRKEINRLAYHFNPTLAKARSKSADYNDHECKMIIKIVAKGRVQFA